MNAVEKTVSSMTESEDALDDLEVGAFLEELVRNRQFAQTGMEVSLGSTVVAAALGLPRAHKWSAIAFLGFTALHLWQGREGRRAQVAPLEEG